MGVYSRYPITESTRIGGYGLGMVNARVRVDGVRQDTSVASVHFAASVAAADRRAGAAT